MKVILQLVVDSTSTSMPSAQQSKQTDGIPVGEVSIQHRT